ncbi:MAG: hypothetical protein Q6352_008360 [Candidatus Freyrarchaeum guaymaensis]
MVKLVPLVCPNCGAKLELPENLQKAFCSFCGTQLIIDTEQRTVKVVHQGEISIEHKGVVKVGKVEEKCEVCGRLQVDAVCHDCGKRICRDCGEYLQLYRLVSEPRYEERYGTFERLWFGKRKLVWEDVWKETTLKHWFCPSCASKRRRERGTKRYPTEWRNVKSR